MTIRNVIEQLDTQLAMQPEASPYWEPIKNLPDSFSQADKDRLTTSYRDMVAGQIYPANQRLRDFLSGQFHRVVIGTMRRAFRPHGGMPARQLRLVPFRHLQFPPAKLTHAIIRWRIKNPH